MATTTTNFGWDIPQSTDLVKDGATAIAALGQDIDTALVDLKGGTTGQVLKKTSATDLDVEWGTASSGLTLINTTSFSAVSSISVNDVFSATYSHYLIVPNIVGSTISVNCNMRLRVGGADNSSAQYRWERIFADSGTVTGQRTTGLTSWEGVWTVESTFRTATQMLISNPFLGFVTTATNLTGTNMAGDINVMIKSFCNDAATSYTGFTLLVSSGTITGSVSVYGYSV